MRVTRLALTAALVLGAGCKSQSRTMLVVEVSSNLSVPGELTSVRVTVKQGGNVQQFPFSLVGAQYGLPLRVGLVEAMDSKGEAVDVVATGLRGDSAVVSEEATTGFLDGRSMLLRLFLARECIANTCQSVETCTQGGACRAKLRAAAELEPFEGSAPRQVERDAGDAHVGDTGGDAPETKPATIADASVDQPFADKPVVIDVPTDRAPGEGPDSQRVMLSFVPAMHYSVGSKPSGVAVADLDGDGHPDLAVCNNDSGDVSILRNRGDGSFAGAAGYATGLGPSGIALGDLNGDGRVDVAVSNLFTGRPGAASGDLSVLRNTGNGTFAAAINYDAGGFPAGIAIADFDGDGKADLAVANGGAGVASVILNVGDGTFLRPVPYAAGLNPASLAPGDMNGDGKIDLAVTYGSGLSLLLNDGGGKLRSAINFATRSNPSSVALGDLDGDHKTEMVVTNSGSGNISVFRSNGDATFASAIVYAVGAGPSSVARGDLNGDARPDLAIANAGDGNVSVLLNSGDGSFAAAINFTAGKSPSSIAMGDFNGDGRLDIAVANAGSGNVSVLLNSSR